MTKFKNIHFAYLSEDKEEQQHTTKQHPIAIFAQKNPLIARALEILGRLEVWVANELYCEVDDSRLLPLRVENSLDDSFTENLTSQDISDLVVGLNEIRYILEHQENTYPVNRKPEEVTATKSPPEPPINPDPDWKLLFAYSEPYTPN